MTVIKHYVKLILPIAAELFLFTTVLVAFAALIKFCRNL
jgi:hypothetical protein